MLPLVSALSLALAIGACFVGGSADDGSDSTETGSDSGMSTETGESADTETECTMTDCEGACVDLSSDSLHCGSCGFDCLGGACEEGVCQPVDLATNKGRLFMVEVDEEHVYYGGEDVFVGRMTTDGLDDTILSNGGELCSVSAITPEAVLWGSDVSAGIRGCLKPDCLGGVTQFFDGTGLAAMTYASRYSKLYWNQGGDIFERIWPGGMLVTIVSGQTEVVRIDTDESHLYWVANLGAADKRLRKVDFAGLESITELVGPREVMGSIEIAGQVVFWSELDTIYWAQLPDGIGAGEPAVFASSAGTVRDMIADATHLYWIVSNLEGVGYLHRCPVDGCSTPEELAELSRPWNLAMDEQAVYWATETGFVGKLRK